ncbi:MAG: hypothetical protein NTV48_02085 [Candidatus Vogelbacteria bacterium]|nr:hypothetical protein [Candidatus Vogelbacteria bacterium]
MFFKTKVGPNHARSDCEVSQNYTWPALEILNKNKSHLGGVGKTVRDWISHDQNKIAERKRRLCRFLSAVLVLPKVSWYSVLAVLVILPSANYLDDVADDPCEPNGSPKS